MKTRAYIETSVVSYYVGHRSRDLVLAGRQQCTQDFWPLLGDSLAPFVSALVVKEASQGDAGMAQRRLDAIEPFRVLAIAPEAEHLAAALMEGRGVPVEFPEDALHIAVAACAGMDLLITWNFAHINNAFTKMMIRQIAQNEGYVCPEIISPDALLGDEP